MPNVEQNVFDIEKQIYNTQWTNIRHHWDETTKAVRYLSTLIIFTIIPLKFLKVTSNGIVSLGSDPDIVIYLKVFLIITILLIATLTGLNQHNHFKRSREARRVVVAIERKWGLYNENEQFKFQDIKTDYSYGKFAGGEKRFSHSQVQFGYILTITAVGLLFVIFA